eukprot:995170-Amphidinium_carterae.1
MLACLQGLAEEPWGVKWLALRKQEQLHVNIKSDSSTDIDAAEPMVHNEESATELMRHMLYSTVHRLQDRGERLFLCGRAASELYVPIALSAVLQEMLPLRKMWLQM